MKKLLSILCTGLLLHGIGPTFCGSYDDPVTGNACGNNSIPERRTVLITASKKKYNDFIGTSTDTCIIIEDKTCIGGVIIGDDESGNIYKQLVVGDETGAVIVGVNNSGPYIFCPVGQKVIIDCKGLQIDSYRKLVQIGLIYEGKVGRMFEYIWKQHVRSIDGPKLFYDGLRPLEISTAVELTAVDMRQVPLFVTLENVSFPDANSTTTYTIKEDVANPNLSFVEHNINYADDTKPAAMVHISIYANFSKDVLPQGILSVIDILTRYNNA